VTLQRLVLDFRSGELVVRCLYSSSLDAPTPGTKARAREVSELTRAGLQDGTSGFTTTEDLLSVALFRPDELREAAPVTVFIESASRG
jgi:hypothetical protein